MGLTAQFVADRLAGLDLRFPVSGLSVRSAADVVLLGVSSARSGRDAYHTRSFPISVECLRFLLADQDRERQGEARILKQPCRFLLDVAGYPGRGALNAVDPTAWLQGRTRRMIEQSRGDWVGPVLCAVTGAPAADVLLVGCAVQATGGNGLAHVRTFAVSRAGAAAVLADPAVAMALIESRLGDPAFEFSIGQVLAIPASCPSSISPCGC